MLRYGFKHLHKYKKFMYIYLISVVVLNLIDLSIPTLTGNLIDELVGSNIQRIFFYIVAAITTLNFTKILFQYINNYYYTVLSSYLQFSISDELYQKIYDSCFITYKDSNSAMLTDQIITDSSTLAQFFSSSIFALFFEITNILFCSIIIYTTDVQLFYVIMVLIPVYIITYMSNKTRIIIANKEYKNESNHYFDKNYEQIDKLHFVKLNSISAEMHSRLDYAFSTFLDTSIKCVKTEFLFTNLNFLFVITIYSIILILGGYRVYTHHLSIGSFSIISTYFNHIISSLSYCLGFANTLQDNRNSYSRITQILCSPSEKEHFLLPNSFDTIHLKNLKLNLNGISFIYPEFVFTTGKIYGITGNNGAGKTTFFNILAGLMNDSTSGSIKISNTSLSEINLHTFRKEHLSVLDQESTLINMPLSDFFNLGISTASNCNSIHLTDMINSFHLSTFLNTVIVGNGSNLSGGERQKIALTRTLNKSSQIYLLDEPTSALDSDSISVLFDILKQKKVHSIIIIITHDQNTLAHCDEIIEF